jgi:hypothetical protein
MTADQMLDQVISLAQKFYFKGYPFTNLDPSSDSVFI